MRQDALDTLMAYTWARGDTELGCEGSDAKDRSNPLT